MSSSCSGNCESCASNCSAADKEKRKAGIEKAPQNEMSNIKHVIGVVSGKGGVGKSLVTAMLAVEMNRREHNVAILDADITGPSIPKLFGLNNIKAMSDNLGIYPAVTDTDIEVMSINLMLENNTDPVVWRGPVIAGAVKQFWTDVVWDDVDYMFVDMPPGTGDVPLTVFQSLPIDGIVIVTTPQDLVSMIVGKAVKMAGLMNVPILGMVENMSYFKCPDCGKIHNIFGKSKVEEVAKLYNIEKVARLPIDPAVAEFCDRGEIEQLPTSDLAEIANIIENLA